MRVPLFKVSVPPPISNLPDRVKAFVLSTKSNVPPFRANTPAEPIDNVAALEAAILNFPEPAFVKVPVTVRELPSV